MSKFYRSFKAPAEEGDLISTTRRPDGTYVVAYLVRDNAADRPDEMQDGFWPSHNPNDAGYVPPEDFEKAQARAEEVMRAYEAGEWFYVGVVLRIENDDDIVQDNAASLWGIDCNYPGSDNSYLTDVANQLLAEL